MHKRLGAPKKYHKPKKISAKRWKKLQSEPSTRNAPTHRKNYPTNRRNPRTNVRNR